MARFCGVILFSFYDSQFNGGPWGIQSFATKPLSVVLLNLAFDLFEEHFGIHCTTSFVVPLA